MALKTFNLNEKIYKQFSKHCKENGISMSKKIEKFIQKELENLKPEKQIQAPTQQKESSHPLEKYC